MNPAERIKLITEIALKLQTEHNTVQINMLLSGYNIQTDDVDIVDSKKNYVINILKNESAETIYKIAFDLKILDKIGSDEYGKKSKMTQETEHQNIFISHASKNANYGNSLVELLTGIGILHEQIIFTSNVAYGIPIGENIFDWLKSKINEKPFVIYLLSTEYYASVACLNEMGAAWIIENKNAMIFTPDFDLRSYEFQNGAIDPRKIGFFINDKDRITGFIESLKTNFSITKNQVLISQKTDEFLEQIAKHISEETKPIASDLKSEKIVIKEPQTDSLNSKNEIKIKQKIYNPKTTQLDSNSTNGFDKLYEHLHENKLKDEEIILIEYINETGRYKLGTGWQEQGEIDNIKEWEDLQSLKSTLSDNYARVLRRFEMRKLLEVSEVTSYGNPKELKLTNEMTIKLFEKQEEFFKAYVKVKEANTLTEEDKKKIAEEAENWDSDLPF